MRKLHKKQIEIYNFINETVGNKGYPPSIRETMSAVGLKSPSTVHKHLNILEKHKLIQRDPKKPRTITLSQPPAPKKEDDCFSYTNSHIVYISGNHFSHLGFRDQDIVYISRKTPLVGDIVLSIQQNTLIIKKIEKSSDITLDIIGKIVGVLKSFSN